MGYNQYKPPRKCRIPERLARAEETPEHARDRMQQNFEERTAGLKASKKACKALEILRGDEIVQEHYIGSFVTNRGGFTNICQWCDALRFPGERESICCQKGKVRLPPVPEPTPILKNLLEDKDPRSKVFKKHIIAINSALGMACMKVKHKKPPTGTFQPQVIIQGKVYYYIGALEDEQNEQPKFAALYVHDPELEGAARKNNLYLPRKTPEAERKVCEEVLIDIQNELHEYNVYVKDFQQICQIPENDLQEASFVISAKERPKEAGTRT